MAASFIRPYQWVAIRMPSDSIKIEQMIPHKSINLGKFGTFKTDQIINRPFYLTWEILDKSEIKDGRELRVIPASELNADTLLEEAESNLPNSKSDNLDSESATPNGQAVVAASDPDFDDYGIPSSTTNKNNANIVDDPLNQKLTMEEIEALKADDMSNPRELIAKIMQNHSTLDQKTAFSLAKYTIRKQKKYMRRFTALPVDPSLLADWFLSERDHSKVMEIRNEMLGLIGCWANVHASPTATVANTEPGVTEDRTSVQVDEEKEAKIEPQCRYLVVDDTGGLVVATLAERMGVLYHDSELAPSSTVMAAKEEVAGKAGVEEAEDMSEGETGHEESGDHNLNAIDSHIAQEQISGKVAPDSSSSVVTVPPGIASASNDADTSPPSQENRQLKPETQTTKSKPQNTQRPQRQSIHDKPLPTSNTIHMIHSNTQPNLSLLRYFNFDANIPPPAFPSPNSPPPHPLYTHLKPLSWLQLLEPDQDSTYTEPTPKTPSEIQAMKSNARSTYYRKRRRWSRCKSIVDEARAGKFDALIIATYTNPLSILSHLVPLLTGGAQIVIYHPHIEPLNEVIDAYSTARRTAYLRTPAAERDAERFKNIDPTLALGFMLQTSRARPWQVLPGRTHPLMTSKGGAEGYLAVGTRVIPLEGVVVARGKSGRSRGKKRTVEDMDNTSSGEDNDDDTKIEGEIEIEVDMAEEKEEDKNETGSKKARTMIQGENEDVDMEL